MTIFKKNPLTYNFEMRLIAVVHITQKWSSEKWSSSTWNWNCNIKSYFPCKFKRNSTKLQFSDDFCYFCGSFDLKFAKSRHAILKSTNQPIAINRMDNNFNKNSAHIFHSEEHMFVYTKMWFTKNQKSYHHNRMFCNLFRSFHSIWAG